VAAFQQSRRNCRSHLAKAGQSNTHDHPPRFILWIDKPDLRDPAQLKKSPGKRSVFVSRDENTRIFRSADALSFTRKFVCNRLPPHGIEMSKKKASRAFVITTRSEKTRYTERHQNASAT
jgi:hypothetical protein